VIDADRHRSTTIANSLYHTTGHLRQGPVASSVFALPPIH
jgi:hypothetical protein